MTPDLINGLFEVFGGIAIWGHIRRAHKDRKFSGVSLWPVVFFNTWGVWNLYYYPSLSQWWSFFGGCNIVIANTVWVAQMIYYRGRK